MVSRGSTPNYKRVCVFVDGENFRFSLADLFRDEKYDFEKRNYLPDADWTHFFRDVCAGRFGWELLRVYWYTTREIDYWPHEPPFEWEDKRRFLERHKVLDGLRKTGYKKTSTDSKEGLLAIAEELKKRRQQIQQRSDGWRNVHRSIERNNNHIEFRSTGSIRYNLLQRKFGKEKGVDTQLATDLITLADIYDIALIVSGDADYIPPVKAVKRMGKTVYSVAFLNEAGDKLPGGAVRLERLVDGKIELPLETVREGLAIGCSDANVEAKSARAIAPTNRSDS